MSESTNCSDAAPIALRCQGLYKSYGALRVTDDLSLDLRVGEIHALIGPNGAGKTTALAQLSGELASDEGSVWIGEEDVTALSLPDRVHAGIARSYQISSVFGNFTAQQQVELALQAVAGHSFRFFRSANANKARAKEASDLLELVGLGSVSSLMASELSHGQTRQLEIAMALSSKPKALLLDEPMAGMAPLEANALADLVADLGKDIAVLLVEHDMEIVFRVADRISVLAEGQRIATGAPAEIRSNAEVQQIYLRDDEDDVETSS